MQQEDESAQRTTRQVGMEVERGRVPSPSPPSSPCKENSTPSAASVPTSPSSGADASGDWPPSLKEYVSRAFASVKDEKDRDLIQDLLKRKLTDAFNTGRSKMIDWDREPLPHEAPLSSSPQPGLSFNHKNSRWGSSGFHLRGGNRGRMGRVGFQGHRNRSPPGYRRPRSRSYSRSRSSSPFSRSSRSFSRSRSRSRSPPSRSSRRSRRKSELKGRIKFRDLGSESDSDSGSGTSRSPVPRRRSFVDKRIPEKGVRGRGLGRGAKANQLNKKDTKKGKK